MIYSWFQGKINSHCNTANFPFCSGINNRRHAVFLLLSMILFIFSGCSRQSIPPHAPLDVYTASLDQRVSQWLERYGIPGVSMALIQDGELVWSSAYGYADIEQSRKMTVDTICRVESISKPVTAWGVMHLVEQGMINLDAPVGQYLVNFKPPIPQQDWEKITVRNLLSHSAGLSLGTIGESVEYDPLSHLPSLQEFLTQEVKLEQEPDAGFIYSDVGFNLLEFIIENVTGQDFAVYMMNEVLSLLEMHNSSFEWSETVMKSIPMGYELGGEGVPPYVYPARASGGLFANVEDIARFVSAGMSKDYYKDSGVLSQKSILALHTAYVETTGLYGIVSDGYGLGHFVDTLPDGREAVWHGGQGHGWMTHFHAVPESGDGIVILTNSQRSWPFMAVVLRDWARWSGTGWVKFGILTYGITIMQVFIGLVVLLSLWMLLKLGNDFYNGSRQFAPFAREAWPGRLVQAAAGLGIIAALAWSAAQPYLFISSIFPGMANWAGAALLLLAVVILLAAMFPRMLNT